METYIHTTLCTKDQVRKRDSQELCTGETNGGKIDDDEWRWGYHKVLHQKEMNVREMKMEVWVS